MQSTTQPLISYAALERAFSAPRLQAYGKLTDRDETDKVARYIWNLALANAMQPVLHSLEVAFRNDVARAAARITATRKFETADIPSWLDAAPSMLMEHERRKVLDAKERLGGDPRRWTEGHLIAMLDFGFWVALCRDSYADTRGEGPRLWPRARDHAFQKRPRSATTRAEVFHRFARIRKFRNRVAHHEPIWDRDYLVQHEYILESLSWISPRLAEALREMSPGPAVFHAGAEAYRPHAETLLGTGAGLRALPWTLFSALGQDRQQLVAELLNALHADSGADPTEVIRTWAGSISGERRSRAYAEGADASLAVRKIRTVSFHRGMAAHGRQRMRGLTDDGRMP
jgi:hypothetical protein